MIRVLLAALFSCLLVGYATAQNFPGYPPLNYFYVGQGAAGVPQWLAPPAARTSMGLGTIATQDANAVAITGGTITGLPLPTFPPDAVNKQYVDQNSTGLTIHPSVNLATTAALPANAYSNGASGVGATLTASCSSSCTAPTIDGSAATLGMRIIVKNEVATANNGIYDVTTVGTGSTPFVLTRSADANQPGTLNFNTIGAGTYALVTGGSTNANTGWVVQSQVASIGISPIIWAQFSASSGVSSIGGLQGAFTCAGNVSCAGNAITVPNVAGGYINKFRNGTFDVWQRGTSAFISTYVADGWRRTQGGALGTCSQQAGHGGSLFSMRCTGAAGNTSTTIGQRIESSVAVPLASNTVTVQFWYQQNTGGAVTPKFSTCFASVQDNFASCTSDIASTSLTSCATATWCLESYTFNASASAGNGYQVTFDCNTALSVPQYCQISAADIRVTPNIATGINVNPPPPELRPIGTELALCQRYLYVPSPGWIFAIGGVSGQAAGGVANFTSNSFFPVQMRTTPTAGGTLTFSFGGSFFGGPNIFYLSSTGIGYIAIAATNSGASFFNNSGWFFTAEL